MRDLRERNFRTLEPGRRVEGGEVLPVVIVVVEGAGNDWWVAEVIGGSRGSGKGVASGEVGVWARLGDEGRGSRSED